MASIVTVNNTLFNCFEEVRGRIKRTQRQFTPPQPVISSRSIDIDIGGTRTYRPKSSVDIIREQHKLIHDVYTANRSQSAVYRGDRQKGELYRKLQNSASVRPKTSTSPHRSISCRLHRPNTAGHLDKIHSSLQSYTSILLKDPDIDHDNASRKKEKISEAIRRQWTPRNHDLNNGQFVRGKGNNTGTLFSSNYNTWITFAGTTSDDSPLVDAFTLFEDEENFYNIDSSVGSKVAHQLISGDKIRIGVNGNMHTRNLKIPKEQSEQAGSEEDDLPPSRAKPSEVIPLNWESQLSCPGVVVREIKGKITRHQIFDNRDTHPVRYEKFFTTPQPRPLLASARTTDKRKNQNILLHKTAHRLSNASRVIDLSSSGDDSSHSLTLDEILQHHIRRTSIHDDGDINRTIETKDFLVTNSGVGFKHDSLKKAKTSILIEKSNSRSKNFPRPVSSISRCASDYSDLSIDMTNGGQLHEQKRLDYRQGLFRPARVKEAKNNNKNNQEFIKFSSQIAAGNDSVVLLKPKTRQLVNTPASPQPKGRNSQQDFEQMMLTFSKPTEDMNGSGEIDAVEIASTSEVDSLLENSHLRTNSPASCDGIPLSPAINIPTGTQENGQGEMYDNQRSGGMKCSYDNRGVTVKDVKLNSPTSCVRSNKSKDVSPRKKHDSINSSDVIDEDGRHEFVNSSISGRSVHSSRTLVKKQSVHFDVEVRTRDRTEIINKIK